MTKYAIKEELIVVLLGAIPTVAVGLLLSWWWAIIPIVLTLAVLSFFRDPCRKVPIDPNTLLSPADGKVVEVRHADGELWIGIFLSVFNVHLNRAPCDGTVTNTEHIPGKYLNALKEESTKVNERTILTLDPKAPIPGPVEVTQISGALARRIVCETSVGDALAQGQRYGMIKLGSRTTLKAPADDRWEILVKPGDTVRAGLSVMARLKSE